MDALKIILQRVAIEKFHGEHDQQSHAGGKGWSPVLVIYSNYVIFV